MSEVHVARDEVLARDVAVKLVALAQGDSSAIDRLEREARAIASLSHENVVTVHDAVRDRHEAAVVMELLPGGTLADRIAAEAPMGWREALEITAEVARGLQAAHERGIVHRDVKPTNVLFTAGGQARVADFGIAGVADATTHTTTVRGSVPYVAPEQVDGRRPDPRTDVYALGCVLVEMLTGRPPFAGDTTAAVIGQHLHRSPEPPGARMRGVPAGVDALVLGMLAKDPASRPRDMGAVLAEIGRLLDDDAAEATTPLPPPATPNAPTVPVASTTPLAPPVPELPVTRDRRTRRGVVVATLGVVVLALLAAWGLQAEDPGATAAPEASPNPSPDATLTTGPDDASSSPADPPPSTAPAPPRTVPEATTAFRRALADGRGAGEVSVKAEEELDKLATEILQKHDEDKPEDVRKKADELQDKIDEYVGKGEVTSDRAATLRDRAPPFAGSPDAAQPCASRARAPVSRRSALVVGDDLLGDLLHGLPPLHGLLLDRAEGLRLGHALLVHEQALGTVDELARLEPSGEVVDLGLEPGHLAEAPRGDLDGREQVVLLEGLDEVGHRPGATGLLDQVPLAECREDEDGGQPLLGDLLGGSDAVHDGHLDVEDAQVGAQLAGQPDGGGAVGDLGDDVEPLLDQHLLEVEADERLVLGDQHPGGAHRVTVDRGLPGIGVGRLRRAGVRHGVPSRSKRRSSNRSCSASRSSASRRASSSRTACRSRSVRAARHSRSASGVCATRCRVSASSATSDR
jgi:serine/threonine protein kinase